MTLLAITASVRGTGCAWLSLRSRTEVFVMMRYVSSIVLPRAVMAKIPFKSLSSNLIVIMGPLGEVATPVMSMYCSSRKKVASRLDCRM